MASGLIIAAPRSGAGKTTVTLALAAAFRCRGLAVAVAKSGPDYIDPAFHAAATGRTTFNLDSWAMPPDLLDALLGTAAEVADLLLIEASMGLFDGVGPASGGRAADLAARWGLPVVLVLDVSGQSQTAAATARGFIGFEPGVAIAGVLLNRLGSARHEAGIRPAMAAIGLPVLGGLLRDPTLALPERHLGLVQAGETADLAARIARLGEIAESRLDLDAIQALTVPIASAGTGATAIPPPGQCIAVARDAAFTFLYPHLLEGWRRAGYPELHGPALAAAGRFKAGLCAFAATRPVHGECGGYMALGQALTDAAGESHEMAGLLLHETSFAKRRLNLGYRRATLIADGPLGAAGTRLRGHEFHYATVSRPGADAPFVQLANAQGTDLGWAGSRRGRVTGSFFHLIATETPSA
jgi:cobyrinic acid a,c-diamide synthase